MRSTHTTFFEIGALKFVIQCQLHQPPVDHHEPLGPRLGRICGDLPPKIDLFALNLLFIKSHPFIFVRGSNKKFSWLESAFDKSLFLKSVVKFKTTISQCWYLNQDDCFLEYFFRVGGSRRGVWEQDVCLLVKSDQWRLVWLVFLQLVYSRVIWIKRKDSYRVVKRVAKAFGRNKENKFPPRCTISQNISHTYATWPHCFFTCHLTA